MPWLFFDDNEASPENFSGNIRREAAHLCWEITRVMVFRKIASKPQEKGLHGKSDGLYSEITALERRFNRAEVGENNR